MQNKSFTPSKKTNVSLKAVTPGHLIVSVLVAALVTAGDAALQYAQTSGTHFSVTQLVGTALISLFGALGTGVVSLEKNPTIEQAIDGAIQPHLLTLSQLISQHINLYNNELVPLVSFLTSFAQQQVQQKQATQQQAPVQLVTQQPLQAAQAGLSYAQPQQLQVPLQGVVVPFLNPLATTTVPPQIVRHWGDTGLVPQPQPQQAPRG